MRSTPTPAEIATYRRDGFVVIADFLTPAETCELAAATAEAVARLGASKLAGGDWQEGDGYYDQVFLQRINLWKLSETVKRYMLGPQFGRFAAELAGVERLRCYHDQTLQKQPWANPTAWHLDDPYWPFSTRDAISTWVALDDATYENGCLYFLPGSHRMVDFRGPGIDVNMAALFAMYPELASIEPVAAPMRAGSASFHNGLTAHGAGANMTPRWRRAMTAAYFPDGATYNGQAGILPPAYAATLSPGDVLEHASELPIVHDAASIRETAATRGAAFAQSETPRA
ncbi:MAG: phytanoyl-CoA dioxygenase family protein [Planctomycetes bacterium]|nr:phytanoyl-CoA dioxygenase family protein [Planctomycetota bacterium]